MSNVAQEALAGIRLRIWHRARVRMVAPTAFKSGAHGWSEVDRATGWSTFMAQGHRPVPWTARYNEQARGIMRELYLPKSAP